MYEMLNRQKVEAMDGYGDWGVVDQRLTWLRPAHSRHGQPQWSSLEQELVDYHARYERACVEE